MCRRAVEIDPDYADAWAFIAKAEVVLRSRVGRQGGDGGLAAVERALALNPELPEGHAVKARILIEESRYDEASPEIDIALRLNPESYEVNLSDDNGKPLGDSSNPLWVQLNKERGRVSVEICYSSTLGECWTLRAGALSAGTTTQISRCPERSATSFQQQCHVTRHRPALHLYI